MNKRVRRIGILTGGGDCPGLNAVIRGITKPAIQEYNMSVLGIADGFEGFVEGRAHELENKDVSGILSLGGTILGTSNKGDPFNYPLEGIDGKLNITDASQWVVKHYKEWRLDAIIAIGGDGTMTIADRLIDLGLNIVGVPKTIDNDLEATDITFGYDTALYIATEAIDRLHTTASSHHRVMIVEVMGRYAGWIALGAGLAGGADVILIPEIPFKWQSIYDKVIERGTRGKRFSIICVAEGAKAIDGDIVALETNAKRADPIRLGGIGNLIAKKIQDDTGLETRATILGHLQRGGSPTPFDRNLATKFGTTAVKLVADGNFGKMVNLKGNLVSSIEIKEAIAKLKRVSTDDQMVIAAKAVGTSFGD